MGGGGGGGWFKGTKGSSIRISDKEMHKAGTHFHKHGRAMGYHRKKDYDAAAKDFAKKYQDHPDAKVFDAKWSGRSQYQGKEQRAISYDGKTVIINPKTGQVIDFYEGTDLRGLYDSKPVR